MIALMAGNAVAQNIPDPYSPDNGPIRQIDGYVYVWGDEFNVDGPVNRDLWTFEEGLKRGNEAQCYTDRDENAYVEGGRLKIMAKKERYKNPNYDPTSGDWRLNTEYTNYTSASLQTQNRRHFLFGRIEVRARINPKEGAFPAIWTCGFNKDWPANGEIDIMEYYNLNNGDPHITANFCVSPCDPKDKWATTWNSTFTPVTYFTNKDPEWIKKYHVWRMDWDEEEIKLYLDDELRNSIKIKEFRNGDGSIAFYNTQFMWLNLAIKDFGHGIEADQLFEVDYFRVYQKYVDNEKPTVITGLKATEIKDTSCKLTWNASTDNVGVYRYDIYNNGMGSGYFVGSTTDTTFTVTGLAPNSEAKFFVRALDAVGNYSHYNPYVSFHMQKPLKVKTLTEFEALEIPKDIYTDILLKTETADGKKITWSSSDPSIIDETGLVNLPSEKKAVTMTATFDTEGQPSKEFNVTVHPRNIEYNQILLYKFNEEDAYTEGGEIYVKDLTGNGYDATLFGNVTVNGTLDLRRNRTNEFKSNGYAMIPKGLLEKMRSFSVTAKIRPSNLNGMPRLYDFGSSSTNSIFCRLNEFAAGLKYNGATTQLINSTQSLSANKESEIAYTFDAKTRKSRLYLNGKEVASGTNLHYEPYEVALIAQNTRNYIGRTQWWDTGSASSNQDYCGTIDDFCIFDIALTEEEIKNIDVPSSINGIEDSNEISIYPNPVQKNECFTINGSSDAKDINIRIINMNGQTVKHVTAETLPAKIENDLAGGIYIATVSSGNKMIGHGKIIAK